MNSVHSQESQEKALPGYLPGSGITPDEVDKIVEWGLQEFHSPGASVAIVKDGEILMAKGYGIADTDTGATVNKETLFQLASVSKTFTAAAFASLVDQKSLSWDKPAKDVLPNFEMYTPYSTDWVTGTDFLVHRAGFPGFFGDIFDHLGLSREDIRHRLRFVEPGYSFRDHPEYSNIGFFLAGEMVAQAGNDTFEEVLKREILSPLQMNVTGKAADLLDSDFSANFAAAHVYENGQYDVVPHNLSKVFVSAGGLASNAVELASYMQMLLNGGQFDEKSILSQEALDQMFEPVITSDISFSEFPPIDENSGYDYSPGWGVYHYNGLKVVEKGGALDGVRTIIVLVPQEKFGIVVLANRNLTALPEAIRAGILQQQFGNADEVDLQEEIFQKSKQIDDLLLGSNEAPEQDSTLSPEQIQAFIGSYNNDLFGEWRVAFDPEAPSSLILRSGPAAFEAEVVAVAKDKLSIRWPIVLGTWIDLDFTMPSKGKATAFTFDGYTFRRQGSSQ
tara:strand:- start:4309 stop:5823 length:1515 start_codon:yes stop_codon:yes gene_type:complete